MIAAVLNLSRTDIKALKITDAYSLHRVVYDLFSDVRSDEEKTASVPSGILFADKGGDWEKRQILILANRRPHNPAYGELKVKPIPDHFLQHDQYGFEVVINPTRRDKVTGKIVPLKTRDQVSEWFIERSPCSWGFLVEPESLQVMKLGVQTFEKSGKTVTHGLASLKGTLSVRHRESFITSFTQGIGRGRAFGFGLLQIVPVMNPFTI